MPTRSADQDDLTAATSALALDDRTAKRTSAEAGASTDDQNGQQQQQQQRTAPAVEDVDRVDAATAAAAATPATALQATHILDLLRASAQQTSTLTDRMRLAAEQSDTMIDLLRALWQQADAAQQLARYSAALQRLSTSAAVCASAMDETDRAVLSGQLATLELPGVVVPAGRDVGGMMEDECRDDGDEEGEAEDECGYGSLGGGCD